MFEPYNQEYEIRDDGIYSAIFCELKFCTPGTTWKCGETGKCRFIGMEKFKLMKKTVSAAKIVYVTEDTKDEKNYKEISWYVKGLGMVKQVSSWIQIIDAGQGQEPLRDSIILVKVKNQRKSKSNKNS